MGRKTLLQSTKKKSATKKDEEEKKTVKAQKTAATKSKTTTKAKKTKAATTKPKKTTKATAKKAATKKTTAAKAKKTTTAKKKSTKARTGKPSLKDLLFKKFDSAMPEKPPKGPGAKKTPEKLPDAPPFISADSKKDAERMKTLLFKQFDLYEKPAPSKAKATPKKKAPSIKDLLFKKFDSAMPEKPPKGPDAKKTPEKLPDAPPFISADSKKDAERMKTLLFKQFDLYERPAASAAKPDMPPPASGAWDDGSAIPPSGDDSEPMSKGLLWGIGLAGLLIAILVWASASNTNNFYIKPADGGIQIWQGKFAPTGSERIVTIEGMEAPQPVKEVYAKEEVLPLVFNYFRGKADIALAARRGPDFAEIKQNLRQALSYAPSEADRRQIQSRLNDIDFVVLFHRAEVAMAKGTKESLESAKDYLNQARSVATTAYQRDLISKARRVVEKTMASRQDN